MQTFPFVLSHCNPDPCLSFQWLPASPEEDDEGGGEPHTVLATLWLGANDSVLPGNVQHVPLEEFRDNLEQICRLFSSRQSRHHDPQTEFVLITPPPISPRDWAVERERRELTGPMDRTNDNTRRYADEVVQLGRELDVPSVDAFAAIWSAATDEANETGQAFETVLGTYFWDGLHLSVKGYKQVVDGSSSLSLPLTPVLMMEFFRLSVSHKFQRGETCDRKELSREALGFAPDAFPRLENHSSVSSLYIFFSVSRLTPRAYSNVCRQLKRVKR